MDQACPTIESRKRAMGALACMPADLLVERYRAIASIVPSATPVRGPEVGLVMLRGRAGGGGPRLQPRRSQRGARDREARERRGRSFRDPRTRRCAEPYGCSSRRALATPGLAPTDRDRLRDPLARRRSCRERSSGGRDRGDASRLLHPRPRRGLMADDVSVVEGGLADPVFGAQTVFRAVMEAFAEPGTIAELGSLVTAPFTSGAGRCGAAGDTCRHRHADLDDGPGRSGGTRRRDGCGSRPGLRSRPTPHPRPSRVCRRTTMQAPGSASRSDRPTTPTDRPRCCCRSATFWAASGCSSRVQASRRRA